MSLFTNQLARIQALKVLPRSHSGKENSRFLKTSGGSVNLTRFDFLSNLRVV